VVLPGEVRIVCIIHGTTTDMISVDRTDRRRCHYDISS
jgi:hypothetical protein